jgi:opacity protein-like surface antigen
MKTSLLSAFIVGVTFSMSAPFLMAQQSGGQRWYEGGAYETQSEVDAMYRRNAEGPLGGLFASSFTRTLTVLGGFNFLSEGPSDQIENFAGNVDDSGYAISFAFGRRHSHSLRSEIEVAFRSNDISDSEVTIESIATSTEAIGIVGSIGADQEEDGSVNSTSLMKNFFIDFNNNTRLTPYLGAGLGLSYVDIEFGASSSADGEPSFQDGEGLFSYQAIGGVAAEVNSFTDFVVEYRFLGTSEVEFDGLDESLSYNTSTLFLGVKFEY